jgi:hypothetical protein
MGNWFVGSTAEDCDPDFKYLRPSLKLAEEEKPAEVAPPNASEEKSESEEADVNTKEEAKDQEGDPQEAQDDLPEDATKETFAQ